MRRVFLSRGKSTWDSLNKILYVEGDLLEEGTFTGMDGIPTHYPGKIIEAANPTIIGTPIKITHSDKSEMVVGFWTKVKGNGRTKVGGYVFDPDGIEFIQTHPHWGLSMESDAQCEMGEVQGSQEIAQSFVYTAASLVEHPAYVDGIQITREVKLQAGGKKKKEKKTMENLIDFKEGAKTTIDAFFEWTKKKLKEADVDEDEISKTIDNMKKAMDSPYPYPAPKTNVKMLEAYLTGHDVKLSEYTDFISECMAEEGMTMAKCVVKWRTEHPEEEAEANTEMSELKTQLEQANKAIDERLDEDITNLTGSIKGIDSEFDTTKFFGGVKDKLLQKKMLSNYHASIKRIMPSKPIKLQLSDDEKDAQKKKLSKDMFGEDSVDDIINWITNKRNDQ